jgi:tripartite-type tricarboxylate transporter receptor subunit TctC
MVTPSSTAMNPAALYPSLPYDPAKDLVPVTMLSVGSVLLAAPASAGYADLRGFLDWARARPRVTYGSWGVGSSAHLYGELLKREHGAPLEHVPYRGEQAAILDVLGGWLDVTFASPVGARPQVASGALKALGMVGDRRSAAMPEVPTFGEQGLAGFDLLIFVAAYVPAGTPAAQIARLNAALRAVAAEPEIRGKMLEQGQTPVGSSPEDLAAIQARDTPRWAALIRQAGARVE